MAYKYICRECGAHLDPGERCDCHEEENIKMQKHMAASLRMDELLERAEYQQERLAFCSQNLKEVYRGHVKTI